MLDELAQKPPSNLGSYIYSVNSLQCPMRAIFGLSERSHKWALHHDVLNVTAAISLTKAISKIARMDNSPSEIKYYSYSAFKFPN